MGVINLKNDKLRNYIKSVLGTNTYGEPMDTLILEIFLREQYVLDLTPQELYEDLINFKNSVKEITFEKVENERWAGVQYPDLKKIVLNFDYWQNLANRLPPEMYYEKLFETISHECLHGMQTKDGVNRIQGYNFLIGSRKHALMEICTQGIAAKMTYNRDRNDFRTNNILTGDGYQDEIFGVPLIAAAFGVSDKDVLKYGVRDYDKLVEILNKNIGDIELTKDFLFQIETQLEYMHSINYPDSDQVEYINLTNEQRKNGITLAMKRMADLANEVLVSRIQHLPLDLDNNTLNQLKTDSKKIKDTLMYEFSHYGGELTENHSTFMMALNSSGNANYIRESMNVFSKILEDKTGNLKFLAPILINAAKLGNFKLCANYGIELLENNFADERVRDAAFNDKIGKNDFNDFKTWDNSLIYQCLSNGLYYVPQSNRTKKKLYNWDYLYTEEGSSKMHNLRVVLAANKQKYKIVTKDVLLEFIEVKDGDWKNKITRTNDARQIFLNTFNTEKDQEFLAKLIAERYIAHTFGLNGTLIKQDTLREQELQQYMLPTYKEKGITGLRDAIAELLVNDEYERFSGETSSLNIAAFGKKNVFDVISQPLINELLNLRQISPEKELALRKSIFVIERKFPKTSASRLASIIDKKRDGKRLYAEYISRETRKEFYEAFNGEKGMEDLVGILCNAYSEQYQNIEKNNKAIWCKNPYLNDIIQKYGEDFFREAMILGIVKGDFSSLQNLGYGDIFSTMSLNALITDLSKPYVEKTISLGKVEMWNLNNNSAIGIGQLDSIAEQQNFSNFNDFLTGLFQSKSQKDNLVWGK